MIQFNNLPEEEWLENVETLKSWLYQIARTHSAEIARLNYNFVSKEEILAINWQYLKHDYYTDIITFGYAEGDIVEGEVYICTEQVKAQAVDFNASEKGELLRVMAHGLLHLIGFDDHEERDKARMRQEEEKSLLLHAQISGN